MSFLDFFKPHDDEYMTGYYWDKRPTPNVYREEGRQTFRYSKASAKEKQFNTVMQNMRLDSERYSIKTCDDCGFKINGYISTQNGLFWVIEDIIHDEQTAGNEEALLQWKSAVKTEFVIRLRRVDNPFEIGV
jgi:hypothetical protein